MMTLLELLVKELPSRGGWPEGVERLEQYPDGSLFYGPNYQSNFKFQRVDDFGDDEVTREQYESALAASAPEWDGEGLPPVGVNAEVLFCADTEPKWFSFLAKFIGENHVIALVGLEEISYKKDELLTSDVKFAPLRSEEDRKRDEITQSILDILNDYDFELVHIRSDQKRIATDIVESIASGMIPHTRID